ncbi:hypothetical protein [Tenacibaculum sp. 190524A02b]|uniref:hypothetical protein n=1 Tax=Tenacibaculum vairaonense TaxID=3137860 RepID=UPI0031FB6DED
MNCNTKLAGKFVRQCGHRPKQGVAKKWYINWEDIDFSATQKANKGTKVTALVLKSGTKIYPAETGANKGRKVKHALAAGDFGKGYIHTDELVLTYVGENESERIQELVDGARVVTINKMVDNGENGEITYKIAGLESGMEIINDDYDSSANSGTTTLIVATNEGEEESTRLKIWSEGSLSDTEGWINLHEYFGKG